MRMRRRSIRWHDEYLGQDSALVEYQSDDALRRAVIRGHLTKQAAHERRVGIECLDHVFARKCNEGVLLAIGKLQVGHGIWCGNTRVRMQLQK